MRRNSWFGMVLAFSLLVWAAFGCSGDSGSGGATPSGTKTPRATPADTPTPAETATGTETPANGETPADAGDPAAQLEGAKGLPGYDETLALGNNPVEATDASIATGKELFVTNCAPCHGEDGSGGGPAAAALDPQPRNLSQAGEYKYGTSDLAVYRSAMYGVPDTGMAPWDGRLSPDDLWNIVNFVKSIQS